MVNVAFINAVSMKEEVNPHDTKLFLENIRIEISEFFDGKNAKLIKTFFHTAANPPEVSHLRNRPNLGLNILVRPIGTHVLIVLGFVIKSKLCKQWISI